MVHLNRIRTKGGDTGETSLGNGTRVPKWHPRILAQGGIDELSAVIGIGLSGAIPGPVGRWLREIQNHLCDLCADLCWPPPRNTSEAAQLRVTEDHIKRLDEGIDASTTVLPPLESFILPGGTPAAAHLHHARTVCRRVETEVHKLASDDDINALVGVYLNRLSDLLFVLARICNDNGAADVLWQPGVISSQTLPMEPGESS
jgi:cob(I)alamin adenosyltransferase